MIGNDDDFATANIRETYRLLKAAGHNVLMVAPATQQSGQGGRSVFTDSGVLEQNTDFDLVEAGAPSVGTDPNDSMICTFHTRTGHVSALTRLGYYNGTPAACAFVGLDYVVPKFTELSSVDLVIAGPNEGTNLGPFLYTLSGTLGYTYVSVGRDIPAIAFSSGNTEHRSYMEVNETTSSGYPDPATVQGQLVVDIVSALVNNTPSGERLLPSGYGISVNTPYISSLDNDSCVKPPFYHTRMNKDAIWDIAVYNETSGVFTYADYTPSQGGNVCINGDCSLPGETGILESGCASSVSVFTIDYDAPLGQNLTGVRSRLNSVVEYMEGTETGSGAGNDSYGGWSKESPPSKRGSSVGGHHRSARNRLE